VLNGFDPAPTHDRPVDAFRGVRSPAFLSDSFRPRYRLTGLVGAWQSTGEHVSCFAAESHYGHDAFLLGREQKEGIGVAFLAVVARSFTAAKES